MRLEAFVAGCKQAHDELVALHLGPDVETLVGRHLAEASLSEAQRRHVEAALRLAMTDGFYTMLLGLDGATSLGDTQQAYRISDEEGELVSAGDGQLEGEAFAQFYRRGEHRT